MKILSWSLDSLLDGSDLTRLFERIDNVVKYISEHEYDILAFQDVSSLVYDRLLKALSEKYRKRLPDENRFRKDGEFLFVLKKYNIASFEYTAFIDSNQNRGFQTIVIDFTTSDPSVTLHHSGIDRLTVVVTRLETGDSVYTIKKRQIEYLNRCIKTKGYENVVLCIDSSTPDYMTDPLSLIGWTDTWYETGNESNRYTIDYQQNLLVPAPIRNRSDRILVSDEFCKYTFDTVLPDVRISRHCGTVLHMDDTL